MESAPPPLVSILITAHNRPAELAHTLRALRELSYPAVELLVVDDASTDSLEPIVRDVWPGACFWRNEQNIGLIGSRTFGMSQARGAYILTLDDDSSPVGTDFLDRAVARLEADCSIGVLAAHIHEGVEPPVAPLAADERYVHSYIGCGNIMRTRAVREIGGYRDYFTYYGEESEYALRLIGKGWRIVFHPACVVHHRMSAVGRADARITAHNFRNTLWTVLLNVPFPRVVIELAWKLIVNGAELAKQGSAHWAVWAVASTVRGLPRVLRERQPLARAAMRHYDIVRFRTVSTGELVDTLAAPSLSDRLHWFWKVWRHRRRARAFWDAAPGGVGRIAWASPSDPAVEPKRR